MRSRLLALIVGLSAMSMLAACDDPSVASLPPSSPVPHASAQDPNVRESASAAPSFDVGHTVHLTPSGIQPLALASLCCDPVVFKNEGTAPVSVIFNVSKINSGPIAPGATWKWVPPNPESVIYHLGTNPNASGQIQVESPNW
jgi:hypothetical protein